MKISRREKAIYSAMRRYKKPGPPGQPDYTRPKLKWSTIYTKEELNRIYKRLMPEIRRVAYHSGYGIGYHGSRRRDLDLIAIPWTDEAVPANTLVSRIMLSMCGMKMREWNWTEKPHGRKGISFPISMSAIIDISVSPFLEEISQSGRKKKKTKDSKQVSRRVR